MELRFKPIYKIKNMPIIYHKVVEHEIIDCWNIFSDRTNGLIEKWNDEFDALYGKRENYDIPEYNEFMRKREQEVADKMTKDNVSKYLTNFTVGEDLSLGAKLKLHPTSFITFALKLIQ